MKPDQPRPHAHVAAALGLLLAAAIGAHAQDSSAAGTSSHVEICLEPAAVMTLPIGSLESIRTSLPCALGFAATTSVNGCAGISVGYIFDDDRRGSGLRLRGLQFALGYDDLSSLFQSPDDAGLEVFDNVNGRYGAARTQFTAAFSLQYVRVAAMLDAALASNLMLRIGPSASIPLGGSSRESEAIISPENMTFLDRTQEREIAEGTGTLTDLRARIGLGASLAYRLPLGSRLFFQPNIGVDYGLTKIQPRWSPLEIRGGISVGYAFIPTRTTPPPVVTTITEHPDTVLVETPRERPFTADVSIDVAAEKLPIEFRRQVVAHYVPMLPTVFFDRNASALAGRYARVAPDTTALHGGEHARFDENTLPANAEQAHHNTLNVFGARLAASPRTRVTLTGTTSRDEENRPDLAGARAQQVADYLTNVWGIARNRITVRSRLDPSLPSSSENAEGLEENRRVEMDFSDESVYHPLQLRVVEPITEPGEIPFRVRAASPFGITRWQADLRSGGTQIARLEGEGRPDGLATWKLGSEDRERVLETGAVSYRLAVYDSAGRSVSTAPKNLPLRLDTTVTVTLSPNQPDNTAEFLLVTFDFDRADLTRRGRTELDAILDRIGPQSHVSITGYTDPIGEGEHNRTLARERARRVALLMPAGTAVESRGAAPEEAPYSSTSPEGRFLSRTVRVVVTSPK